VSHYPGEIFLGKGFPDERQSVRGIGTARADDDLQSGVSVELIRLATHF
jgi:hypothetical protein